MKQIGIFAVGFDVFLGKQEERGNPNNGGDDAEDHEEGEPRLADLDGPFGVGDIALGAGQAKHDT